MITLKHLAQYKKPIQTSVGRLTSVEATFKVCGDPTFSLVDRVIKVGTALYGGSFSPTPSFSFLFPVANGEYEMTNLDNRNYKAYLIKKDSNQIFTIRYEFFASKNFGQSNHLNSTAFNLESDLDTNVNITAYLDYIDLVSSSANIPISVNSPTNNLSIQYFDTSGEQQLGFTPNQDLQVKISILDEVSKSTSNNINVGLYRSDLISNQDNIVDGLGLHYANIANGSTHFVGNCFGAANGFIQYGQIAEAEVTINANCFTTGADYVLYVNYLDFEGNWRTQFNVIRQSAVSRVIIPSVAFTITDEFGNTTNDNCVSGLLGEVGTTLCAVIDKADFNTKLSDNNIGGTYDDYLHKINVFTAASSSATNGQSIFYTQNANNDWCIENFTFDGVGVRYVIIRLTFKYEDHFDFINIPFELKYDGVESDAEVGLELGGQVVTEICNTETGVFDITGIVTTGCIVKSNVNGGEYSESNLVVNNQIDTSLYGLNEEVCVKVLCSDGATGVDECEDCAEFISIDITSLLEVLDNIEVFITVNSPYSQIIVEGVLNGTPFESYNQLKYRYNPGDTFSINKVDIITDDGCIYSGNISYNPPLNVETQSYNIDFDDCQPREVRNTELNGCNNKASILFSCNEETGEVSLSKSEAYTSPLDGVSTFEVSYDGGQTFIAAPATITGQENIFAVLKAKFLDGCPELIVEQQITCIKREFFINEREINLSIVSDQLIITKTDNFQSTPLEDKLYVSLDNGLTYQEFDYLGAGYTPIDLEGGEQIKVRTSTVFDSLAEDITVDQELTAPISDTQTANCYTGYSLTTMFTDATRQFEITKTGDETNLEVNELLWAIGSNPYDNNNTGVPYTNPFVAEGLLVSAWKLKLPDCPEIILYGSAYGKNQVELCDDEPININIQNQPILMCLTECAVSFNFIIACANGILSVVEQSGDFTNCTYEWKDPNGAVISTTDTATATIEGTYSCTIVCGGETLTRTFLFDKPNAGSNGTVTLP